MKINEKTTKSRLLKETVLYGLLSLIYGSLFFFGALYPRYGYDTACIRETDEEEMQEETGEQKEQGLQEESGPQEADVQDGTATTGEVRYKSLFLECLKEWF